MAFTHDEIADHMQILEDQFWTHCRPPLYLREMIVEGQRFHGQTIELFFVYLTISPPESSIARSVYVRCRDAWKIFCKEDGGKWERHQTHPEVKTLTEAVAIIRQEPPYCYPN